MSTSDDGERTHDLPMDEFHIHVEEAAAQLSGRIKQCVRNSFIHLRKSWLLKPVDPEMSFLRVITSEEEAATALILALQLKKYPGSGGINYKDHYQKLGIIPFLDIVQSMLARIECPMPKLSLFKGATSQTQPVS